MDLVMFDIDGTLVQSYDFDEACFQAAVEEVLGVPVNTDWSVYQHVTDAGILQQIIDQLPERGDTESLVETVKQRFLLRLTSWMRHQPVHPVPGAPGFLQRLRERDDVQLAMATGGWRESALMKLSAAGIDAAGIPLATSSDHRSRLDIMRLAERRAGGGPFRRRSYFGDGAWDRDASRALDYRFVLVGGRLQHSPWIPDFNDPDAVLEHIGL
jgi:phosphoglycolate phosphatase-like HAD superfamily hydrolase